MIFHTHTNYPNYGFSLVETLVAIAILLIVIVGPMSTATSAASSTSFANQQITAYFLAQEGLELAQKGRDDLLLQRFEVGTNAAWNEFVNGAFFQRCFETSGCALEIDDTSSGGVEVVSGCDGDCRLYLTSNTSERSRYTYSATNNELTDFTRRIFMEEDSTNQKVLVTAVVSWRTGNQIALQSTTATTYLYNVYGR